MSVLSTREYIERLMDDGWTNDEILERFERDSFVLDGREFHLSAPPDRRRFAAALDAIKTERLQHSDRDFRAEILRLHHEGYGEKGIGGKLGLSEATVQRMRKKLGLLPWPKD